MFYADKLIVLPEHATLAPSICRLAGEVLSIGRRVTQKGVLQDVLKVSAPARHHLGQPNLLQVHDGPVDHVHWQSLHLHPDGSLQLLAGRC